MTLFYLETVACAPRFPS